MPTETVKVGRPPRSDLGHCGARSNVVGASGGTSRVVGIGQSVQPLVGPEQWPRSGLTLGAFLFPASRVLRRVHRNADPAGCSVSVHGVTCRRTRYVGAVAAAST